jgi:parallel beta-helix repeat protein
MSSISRGQGAFEYLLIIGGSVLVASVAMMVVQGSAGEANNSITRQTHSFIGFIENLSEIPTYAAGYNATATPTAGASPTPTVFTCVPACDTSCKFCSASGVCVYYPGYNCCNDTDCPSGYSCANHLCNPPQASATPTPSGSPTPTPTASATPTPTPTVVPIGGDSTCFMVSSPYYYKLYNSVSMTSGSSCVTFGRYSSGATLDCQGNKISTSITGTTSGLYLGSGVSNINVVNCPIEGFNYGVRIDGASNIRFDRLDLLNNQYGYYITNPDNIFITRNWITHYTTGNVGINASYAASGMNRDLTLFDNYIDHFSTAITVTGISRVNITRAEIADNTYNIRVYSSSDVNVSDVSFYRAYDGIYVLGSQRVALTNNYIRRTGPVSAPDIYVERTSPLGISGNTIPNFYIYLYNVSSATLSSNTGTAPGFLRFAYVNSSVVAASNNNGLYSLSCSSCFYNTFNSINVNANNTWATGFTSRVRLADSSNNTFNSANLSGANVGAHLYWSSNTTFYNLSTSGNNAVGVYAFGGTGNVFSSGTFADGANIAANSTLSGCTVGRNFTVRPVWIDQGCGACNYTPVIVALQSTAVSAPGTIVGTVLVSLSSSTIAGVKNYTMPWAPFPGGYACICGPYYCMSWCCYGPVWKNLSTTITGTGAGAITLSYGTGYCSTWGYNYCMDHSLGPTYGSCGRDLDVAP